MADPSIKIAPDDEPAPSSMTIPEGMAELVDAVPSSIPPALFETEPSEPARADDDDAPTMPPPSRPMPVPKASGARMIAVRPARLPLPSATSATSATSTRGAAPYVPKPASIPTTPAVQPTSSGTMLAVKPPRVVKRTSVPKMPAVKAPTLPSAIEPVATPVSEAPTAPPPRNDDFPSSFPASTAILVGSFESSPVEHHAPVASAPVVDAPPPISAASSGVDALAAEPVEVPFERPSKGAVALMALALVAAVGVVGWLMIGSAKHVDTPSSPAPVATLHPTEAPARSPATATTAAPPAAIVTAAEPAPIAAPTATTGVLETAAAPPGRRIFVDKHTMGQTPQAITIPCGTHVVRIGSSGHAHTIDVPCGGAIDVGEH